MNEISIRRQNRRVSQGDIYKDVFCYENILEKNGSLRIDRIFFPYVIVLTQDCDLQQHIDYDNEKDGQLFSVLVAPIYNAADFMTGDHLSKLGLNAPTYISNKKGAIIMTGQKVNSTGKLITDNQIPRFHCLNFDNCNKANLPPCIVDFKHYFTIGVNFLRKNKKSDFVCRLKPLYRELLTQRFSSYLSRIGLPNPKKITTEVANTTISGETTEIETVSRTSCLIPPSVI